LLCDPVLVRCSAASSAARCHKIARDAAAIEKLFDANFTRADKGQPVRD